MQSVAGVVAARQADALDRIVAGQGVIDEIMGQVDGVREGLDDARPVKDERLRQPAVGVEEGDDGLGAVGRHGKLQQVERAADRLRLVGDDGLSGGRPAEEADGLELAGPWREGRGRRRRLAPLLEGGFNIMYEILFVVF